jgi:UDP-glucose 4-epimerase
MTNKKILILGGGFIGKALALAAQNDNSVAIVDNLAYNSKDNLYAGLNNSVVYIEDVTDPLSFRNIPSGFDFCFYLASPSSIIQFKENESKCWHDTITGLMNTIGFCKENNIKLIAPSSGSTYSPEPNSYARCKNCVEYILEQSQVDYFCPRIFASYGIGEAHKGKYASVIYTFVRDAVMGDTIEIWGDGTQTRDFIHIDDVVNALYAICNNWEEYGSRKVADIGTASSISFNEVIGAIKKEYNGEINVKYVEKPTNYLENTKSDDKIFELIYPKTGIQQGIRELVNYFILTKETD